jgi:hypothetical protein
VDTTDATGPRGLVARLTLCPAIVDKQRSRPVLLLIVPSGRLERPSWDARFHGSASQFVSIDDGWLALRFRRLFGRALEAGRDHGSDTVNTLVLAYLGTAADLLLFGATDLDVADAANLEIVAKSSRRLRGRSG